jgi:predicted lipid-binding transport protein (Tim44 family)/ribosomal protein L31
MVQTPDGGVQIERLLPGQEVLAFDGTSATSAKIEEIFKVQRSYYLEISAAGSTVRATAEHPFYIGSGKFVEASELQVGDTAFLLSGGKLEPAMITSISRIDLPVVAYNLRAGSPHTFFADGFAVHNKGGCFEGSTEISCPNGTKPISEISPGDAVLSFEGGRTILSVVSEKYARFADEYYRVSTESRTVNVTAEHPFYTPDGYVKAQDLRVGGIVFMRGEEGALSLEEITSIELVHSPIEVYNLQVGGAHTFFANDFAVHNKGGCFLSGTMISTQGGEVAIEELAQGESVHSFSENGAVSLSKVNGKYAVIRDSYYEISAGGRKVSATDGHPFYTDRGYKTSEELRAGDILYSLEGGSLSKAQVESVNLIVSPILAYNLEVDGDHTFFAEGFAVHNKGGGSSRSSSSSRSKPPPNTYYLGCSSSFNESGVQKQCCRQASSKRVSAGAAIAQFPYKYCFCRTQSGIVNSSIYAQGATECTCTDYPAYDLARKSPPACPTDPIAFFCFGTSVFISFAVFIIFVMIMAGLAPQLFGRAGFGEWSSTASAPHGKVLAKAGKVSALLSFWSKVDPAWDENAMKERAKAVFFKLQECWGKREYAEMEPLLASSIYAQHTAQLEAMAARHEINRMENLKLLDLQIVLVKRFDRKEKDEFTTWLKATARDTIVDDRTGRKIRGDSGNGIFEEFWTFARGNDSWRLREIDQPEEGMRVIGEESFDQSATPMMMQTLQDRATTGRVDTSVSAMREQDGADGSPSIGDIKEKGDKVHRLLNFLSQADRIWDEQGMLEQARTIFILLNTCVEKHDLSRVQGSLAPGLLFTIQMNVDGMKQKGMRAEKGNLAVRNVEIVLVDNQNDRAKDSFTAWISGQAQNQLVDTKTGARMGGDAYVRDFEEYWTFRRDGNSWKLASIDAGRKGSGAVSKENVDQGTSDEMLKWYYTKDRAV